LLILVFLSVKQFPVQNDGDTYMYSYAACQTIFMYGKAAKIDFFAAK